MSSVAPTDSTTSVHLLIRIEELREMARAIMADVEDLQAGSVNDLKTSIDIFEEVRHFEVKLIRHALLLANGQQLRASRLLGLKPTTLSAKIKRYKIKVRL